MAEYSVYTYLGIKFSFATRDEWVTAISQLGTRGKMVVGGYKRLKVSNPDIGLLGHRCSFGHHSQ